MAADAAAVQVNGRHVEINDIQVARPTAPAAVLKSLRPRQARVDLSFTQEIRVSNGGGLARMQELTSIVVKENPQKAIQSLVTVQTEKVFYTFSRILRVAATSFW